MPNEVSKLLTIASWVIATLLFVYSSMLLIEGYSTVKAGQIYHPPQAFVDQVGQAITAGLVVLGIPMLTLILKKKDK
jgi:hypothetical protein